MYLFENYTKTKKQTGKYCRCFIITWKEHSKDSSSFNGGVELSLASNLFFIYEQLAGMKCDLTYQLYKITTILLSHRVKPTKSHKKLIIPDIMTNS